MASETAKPRAGRDGPVAGLGVKVIERGGDAPLNGIHTRRRTVPRVDAAEHDQPVAIGLEDRRIVRAAREFHGEARDLRLHQAVEQLGIGVSVL